MRIENCTVAPWPARGDHRASSRMLQVSGASKEPVPGAMASQDMRQTSRRPAGVSTEPVVLKSPAQTSFVSGLPPITYRRPRKTAVAW